MAINWSDGYSSRWRVHRVNPVTWADAEEVRGISSVTIERTGSGSAPLLESGTMKVDSGVLGEFEEGYYRISMVATQGDVSERVNVSTMYCTQTGGSYNVGAKVSTVNCRSVLFPASVSAMQSGSYIRACDDGVEYACEALRGVLAAPVEGVGHFYLNDSYVFDIGTSVLAAVWTVLSSGGWAIQIDGSGRVMVLPKPEEPSLVLDASGARLVERGIDTTTDLAGVPNRYIAVRRGEVAVATNEDASSPTSRQSRGFWHDQLDKAPRPVMGETLEAYAQRRLEECSTILSNVSYRREYWPDVLPFSIVRGTRATVGVDGDMTVVSQSLRCGAGISVAEKAALGVRTWQRS